MGGNSPPGDLGLFLKALILKQERVGPKYRLNEVFICTPVI